MIKQSKFVLLILTIFFISISCGVKSNKKGIRKVKITANGEHYIRYLMKGQSVWYLEEGDFCYTYSGEKTLTFKNVSGKKLLVNGKIVAVNISTDNIKSYKKYFNKKNVNSFSIKKLNQKIVKNINKFKSKHKHLRYEKPFFNAMKYLPKIKNLESLTLVVNSLEYKYFKYIKKIKKLKSLEIINNNFLTMTKEYMEQISKLKKLKYLNLYNLGITDKILKKLKLKNLIWLDLSYNDSLTYKGIEHIKSFKKLEYLDLYYSSYTTKSKHIMKTIKNLKKLRFINLYGFTLSKKDKKYLAKRKIHYKN